MPGSGTRISSNSVRFKLALGFLLPLLALATACKKDPAGPAGPAMQAMPVQVQIVQAQKISDSSEYLAILKSRHSAVINPQVEGQITKIFVKSGDRVKAGSPLLQIDPLKQQATLGSQVASHAAQEANLRYAQTQLERERRLFEAGVVSKQEFDNAQTAYDAAVAQLKSLGEQVNQQQVELHYYRVSAPMSGIIGDIPVREGDRVAVTTLLTTVDEPGTLEAYIYVPAERGKDLRVGLPVHLLDESGKPVSDARVTFVSPEVDNDTQTILAKASIENPKGQLRVSQQMRAQVVWSNHQGPVVPVLSVTRINGRFFVFVAVKESAGTFARQKGLTIGDTVGNDYVVLDGLKTGDHLIVSGTQFLQDGMPVAEQIQNASASPAPDNTGKDAGHQAR
ncbi:MAG TPA: efflux RND transporter periplasmic adaptor subunit [Verrucomicrobiae bacterium]|jgi:RND family efflux transporter MFP subunit|nr:efflux RND transporter periplasmic adaptor subunit [Verrucomicrobiae bacterium]